MSTPIWLYRHNNVIFTQLRHTRCLRFKNYMGSSYVTIRDVWLHLIWRRLPPIHPPWPRKITRQKEENYPCARSPLVGRQLDLRFRLSRGRRSLPSAYLPGDRRGSNTEAAGGATYDAVRCLYFGMFGQSLGCTPSSYFKL